MIEIESFDLFCCTIKFLTWNIRHIFSKGLEKEIPHINKDEIEFLKYNKKSTKRSETKFPFYLWSIFMKLGQKITSFIFNLSFYLWFFRNPSFKNAISFNVTFSQLHGIRLYEQFVLYILMLLLNVLWLKYFWLFITVYFEIIDDVFLIFYLSSLYVYRIFL